MSIAKKHGGAAYRLGSLKTKLGFFNANVMEEVEVEMQSSPLRISFTRSGRRLITVNEWREADIFVEGLIRGHE